MSTGTGEREAREKAHSVLNTGEYDHRCRGSHSIVDKGLCDRLTKFILSTDAELRRVEGERDEATLKMLAMVARLNGGIEAHAVVIAERERDEARASLAVVREQALREARLAVAKAPLLVFKPDGPSYVDRDALLVALEALAARPDVAPAGKKGE